MTLPPAGIDTGRWYRRNQRWHDSAARWYLSAMLSALLWWATTFITVTASRAWPGFTAWKFFFFPIFLFTQYNEDPPGYWERNFHEYFEGVAGLYAALGCAGAAWLAVKLAVRALTTTTLSVGEFQWEYKETIAGLSLIPTCYRQGTTEDLDISRDGDKIVLITGLTKVDFGRQNVGALSDKELNWVVDSVQIYQRQITAI